MYCKGILDTQPMAVTTFHIAQQPNRMQEVFHSTVSLVTSSTMLTSSSTANTTPSLPILISPADEDFNEDSSGHGSSGSSSSSDESDTSRYVPSSPLFKPKHREIVFDLEHKINHLPSAALLTDAGGKIRHINSAALRLFGLERSSVIDTSILEFMPEQLQQLHVKVYQDFLKSGRHHHSHPISSRFVSITQKSQVIIQAYISIEKFRYINDELLVLAIFSDSFSDEDKTKAKILVKEFIHEMKTRWSCYQNFNKSLHEIQADRDRLLAYLLHELGNKAHVLSNFIKFSLNGLSDVPSEKLVDLTMADDSCQSLIRLIKEGKMLFDNPLLNVTRVFINHEMQKLAAMLKHLVEFNDSASPSGIEFIYKNNIFHETALIMDLDKFTQVIQNLVLNAKSFTPTGGSITFIISLEIETPAAKHSAEGNLNQKKEPSGKLLFSVIDTGNGIPKEKLSTIFVPKTKPAAETPSLRREHGGAGLGLSICQNIIHQLEGNINVQSPLRQEDGSVRGTRFFGSITILISENQTASVASQSDSSEAVLLPLSVLSVAGPVTPTTSPFIPAKILVADDENVNIRVFTRLVENFGDKKAKKYHQLARAVNGQEALDHYIKAAESGEPFDLIFLDLGMPVMNGTEAAQKIIKHWQDNYQHIYRKPLIIITSAAKEGRVKPDWSVDILTKPFDSKVLKMMIENYGPKNLSPNLPSKYEKKDED